MCSIFGLCRYAAPYADVQNALRKTRSRGPDESRIVNTGNGWLGFNRLSIMGLTEEGMQPFLYGQMRTYSPSELTESESGYVPPEGCETVLVCNGEIYGFRPVKDELEKKGYSFISDSDCEILPALYEEYGTGMFRMLDAEFAMILYDRREDTYVAARDPIGIRPLYYGILADGTYVFASEPKNLTELTDEIMPFPPGYYFKNGEFYSYRDMETTSSTTQKTMSGWELYDTVDGTGDFGPWSEWSQTAVAPAQTREVETQTRYRYRDKETTTSTSSSMSGWTLDSSDSAWGGYGAWSDWSTTAVSKSDSRDVESKTQYRYRDISYKTEYNDWGAWSDWTPDYVAKNETTDVETATIYGYYYFQCPNCGKRWHGWRFNCFAWDGGCGTYVPESSWHQMWSNVSWSQAGFQDFHGTGHYVTYYFGERWFKWDDNGQPRTGYRYRTRSSYQQKVEGSWSGWSDSAYSASSSREVQTRTVYRYRDRTQTTTYYYSRWGEWSAWSANAVAQSNTRDVETATFYRYRDRVTQTTYYFRRWSAWSQYSETPASSSETREVQTKTQYRFKSR